MSVEDTLSLIDPFEASHLSAHTGQEVAIAGIYYLPVAKWSEEEDPDTMRTHPLADEFRSLIASASRLSGESLVLFRGSWIQDDEEQPPSANRLGPLPLDQIPEEGRYHYNSERVLYLADSKDGVRQELDAWRMNGTAYVIKVEVPLTSLRIADFSNYPADSLIRAVFSKAENCNVDGRGPENYLFSQVVGQIVKEHFAGMMIPGVRGQHGRHYRNVVLFEHLHLEDWPNWTNSENPPYRLLSTD